MTKMLSLWLCPNIILIMIRLSRVIRPALETSRIFPHPSFPPTRTVFPLSHPFFSRPFLQPRFSFCTGKSGIRNSDQTFKLLIRRLQAKAQYADQLEQSLNDETPSFDKKINKEQARIEIARLAPVRTLLEQIKGRQQNIADLEELTAETKDKGELKMLNEEAQKAKQEMEELKQECWAMLIPAAPYDDANDIIVEFRPGAGGTESSIFVQDISEMYESYCSQQGFKCWVTSSVKETGVSRGYKALDMRIQGEYVNKIFKCEAGVHKVIRVPETESKGRLHSSTISVVVMPVVPFTFQVDIKDIKYQYTKSSGPGGQAVNKIESACRATHIPTGLAVFIQEERSQEMNKKRATDLLKQRLFELEYKRSMEEEQSKRKSQVTTLDRSEKIRTYNYPQDRITDHRTGLTKFGIKAMMSGELLDEFLGAFEESVNNEKIDALIEEIYSEAGISLPKH